MDAGQSRGKSPLALRDSIGSAQHGKLRALIFFSLTNQLDIMTCFSLNISDSVTVTADTEAIRWDKSFYDEAKYRSGLRNKGRRMGALWKGKEKSRIQNTGANPFVGKCVQHDQLHGGKGKLNIECRTSGFRISHPSNVKLFGNVKNSQNQELRLSSNNKKDNKFRMKTEASGPKPVSYYSFPYNGRSIGSKESHSVSYRATDQFQKTMTENHIDAVAEVYNMMAKDYHTKAKSKPPINNQQPFDEEP
ncbi:hypothetical protein IEQ34_005117 [Dendrobium chrysotoxum]|uniref:Uncharacterized protein n=1 Tax=Dendrobium chrysotoxum TaxID=161865 RepID=A0AAV7GU64_DENCH|nr:hypothetical protein IEQ34_005117 [Dendrobium chrysotoxum]